MLPNQQTEEITATEPAVEADKKAIGLCQEKDKQYVLMSNEFNQIRWKI